MWGDDATKGYGLVKFNTSPNSVLVEQKNVKVHFNCQVRADRMGPNPGYKADTSTNWKPGYSTAQSSGKPLRITYLLEPLGVRRPMSVPVPKKVAPLKDKQKSYYERLAAFHAKSDQTAIRSTSKGESRSLGKASDQGNGR